MAELVKKEYNLITKKRGSRSKIMNISKILLNIGLKKILEYKVLAKNY